ncbi:MAG TPA: hypothetical protein DDW50_08405 [Firmicutes bacterium]|jgi:pyruvate formate lyase activating enzyme|nr:hypothetical protein [Bacillota bacterium]
MGCIFCHNPESWDLQSGEELDGTTLMRRLERCRPFLHQPGLTISGGEPLMQPGFTLEVIRKAKTSGWHVALDTSGWGPAEVFQRISEACDLVIFSIKHPLTPEKLAPGADHQNILTNLETLAGLKIKVWLRYVLLPGWNAEPDCLAKISVIAKGLPNLERLEVLPFNSLAVDKWRELGKDSPLWRERLPKVSEERIIQAEQQIGWHKSNCSSMGV